MSFNINKMNRNMLQNGGHSNSITSPLDSMSSGELVKIIKKHLWDTEINLNLATRKELLDFLKEKDKLINNV